LVHEANKQQSRDTKLTPRDSTKVSPHIGTNHSSERAGVPIFRKGGLVYRWLPLLLLFAGSCGECQTADYAHRFLSDLDRNGVNLSVLLSADTFAAQSSKPNSPHWGSFQFLDLAAEVDLAKISPLLRKSNFFASMHVNGSYSADFSDALQSYAGLSFSPGVRLPEVWIQYRPSHSLNLRAGRIDANIDFAYVETGAGFLNSAFGYDPTFFDLPNYGSTNWGAELLFSRTRFQANFAIFSPSDGTGALLMQEVSTRWQQTGRKGRVAVGFWQRTGTATSLLNTFTRGVRGSYLVAEQTLWMRERQAKHAQSLSGFVQVGIAPPSVSVFTQHYAAGLVWEAPTARRDSDSAGFAITSGRLTSSLPASFDSAHESVWEAYYRFSLPHSISVSPDVQYAIHPGGISSNRNSFAAGARISYELRPSQE